MDIFKLKDWKEVFNSLRQPCVLSVIGETCRVEIAAENIKLITKERYTQGVDPKDVIIIKPTSLKDEIRIEGDPDIDMSDLYDMISEWYRANAGRKYGKQLIVRRASIWNIKYCPHTK